MPVGELQTLSRLLRDMSFFILLFCLRSELWDSCFCRFRTPNSCQAGLNQNGASLAKGLIALMNAATLASTIVTSV